MMMQYLCVYLSVYSADWCKNRPLGSVSENKMPFTF